MKILHLVLKAQWYNLIEQGVKEEEYRDITPCYDKRLRNADGTIDSITELCSAIVILNNTIEMLMGDVDIALARHDLSLGELKHQINITYKTLERYYRTVMEYCSEDRVRALMADTDEFYEFYKNDFKSKLKKWMKKD